MTIEKKFILFTSSGQPAVQSDDKNCIVELAVTFGKGSQIMQRGEDGRYTPLSMLEMEGVRCRLSS